MNNSFLQIAKVISPKDWTSLGRFILMSNSEKTDLTKLFRIYEKYKTNLDAIPAIEAVIQDHFPKMTKKGFLNLNSRLFQTTEDWFAYSAFAKNEDRKEVLLNKAYNDHGLYKLANQKSARLQKRWEERKQASIVDLQLYAILLHQQYYSDNPIKYKKDSTLLANLVNAHLSNIKLSCLIYELELHNWGRLKQIDFSVQSNIIQAATKILPDSSLSEILLDLNKVVSELDLDSFLKVKTLLLNNTFERPSELHTLVTLYLINAGIKLWQNGHYTDAAASSELIEYGLSTKVLMQSGKIPRIRFFNLIATLGKLKSFAWTQEFIDRWHENVETQNVAFTKSLAEALNAFSFEKYDLIIPKIRGIEFQDFIEKFRAQGLELIAIYVDRKNNYSLLRSYINNFKRTIRRNEGKLSSETIKAYKNFVKVVELLMQRDFLKVKINLEKFKTLVYREWLYKEVGKNKG